MLKRYTSGENSTQHHTFTQDLIFDYIQRWGNHASVPLIERPCNYFSHDAIDGTIGYHQRKSSRIIFGDPLCAHDRRKDFVKAFHDSCKEQRSSAIYLNSSNHFTHWFIKEFGGSSISLGNELIINPQRDMRKETGFYARDLRWKHKKSLREGITMHEYLGNDPGVEKLLQEVGHTWLSHRKGRQACLFPINIFNNRKGKRWFYAMHQGKITGVLTINRIDAVNGWIINMLMCLPTAVNSTSAFMLMHVFDQLNSEGCTFFSAGFIPDNTINHLQGFGATSSWILRRSYTACTKLLKLQSKKQFWNQFEPEAQPTYLLFPSSCRVSDMIALLQTLHIVR